MKAELRNFLEEYLKWAELDAPESIFNPRFGLCFNLEGWCRHMGYGPWLTEMLINSMESLFFTTGVGKGGYPFGGRWEYKVDQHHHTHHKNPKRIAWIKAQVGKQ